MSRLEKISKALAGESLTGAVRGVGEAIGYVGAGGDFADVPEVLREQSKNSASAQSLVHRVKKTRTALCRHLALSATRCHKSVRRQTLQAHCRILFQPSQNVQKLTLLANLNQSDKSQKAASSADWQRAARRQSLQ